MFIVPFDDGSVFELPEEWEPVFVDYFGPNPESYKAVEVRLRFITGKYMEHKAWPSKFDGIGVEISGDEKYDEPNFYWETWEDSLDYRQEWSGRAPTWSEVAEAVLYQQMRPGILQKVLQDYAEKTGKPAPRVVTPRELLRELEDRQGDGA